MHVIVTVDVVQVVWRCAACHTLTVLACLQAVEAGRLDVTQKLIDYGVLLRVFDANLNTPLHLAVRLKVEAFKLGCLSFMQSCIFIRRLVSRVARLSASITLQARQAGHFEHLHPID